MSTFKQLTRYGGSSECDLVKELKTILRAFAMDAKGLDSSADLLEWASDMVAWMTEGDE
jgi:hypothetical protein